MKERPVVNSISPTSCLSVAQSKKNIIGFFQEEKLSVIICCKLLNICPRFMSLKEMSGGDEADWRSHGFPF